MKRLVIIDGKSVFYRGYYAMGALSTSDGAPTGGIYGFAAIAMEIVRQLEPTKVVVAWDSKSSCRKRKEIFAEYKAGRVKSGEDFYAQIPMLEELIRALGWAFVECEDYEADDIIGTLALQADEETTLARSSALAGARLAHRTQSTARSDAPAALNSVATDVSRDDQPHEWETFIVSSDLDMLQIVDENTRMYRILKGFSKLEEMDVAAVEEKYGIKKWQFLDLKALKGDASDNIPGVPGIGEKTAAKLLAEFQTLEGIYENLDKIGAATRKKLENGRESAFMSQKLARIMTDAPVELAKLPDLVVDRERIRKEFEKLEFRSLARKFLAATDGAKKSSKKAADLGLFRENAGISAKSGRKKAARAPQRGLEEGEKSEVGHTAMAAGQGTYSQQTLEVVHETGAGKLISWNVKDLMHKNETVAKEVLEGKEFWDLGQGRFLLNPLARNVEHGEEMAEFAAQQREFEERPELYKIFVQFDLPLIPVLYKMEECGMLIDRAYFSRLKEEFSAEVRGLEGQIWQLAGRQFNINSPVQLGEVLFKDLALPTKGIKKTVRGFSTGVKELDKLEGKHEIVGKIKEYRESAKLLSTYIAPLPELADKNGRVHTTFNQDVTATGRLSSTNPNLQNIPVRTEVGKRIREGFIAPEGKVLVSADYSQFELRLAAVLAKDEALIEDFNAGVDIHTKTAAEAFGVPITEVTKMQRRAAKVINFGVLYGMSVRGLAQAAGMSFTEAKEFIERYFEVRKPIKEYLEKLLDMAREQGYVETVFGRRRPTPDVKSSNFIVRSGAERAAQNMPIQGTEADLMKRAMIRVDKALADELPEAKMIMQVHDSLMVECPKKDAEKVSEILRREMEGVAPELKVRLVVDVKVGGDWGQV